MEKNLGKNQSFAREINYELVISLLKEKPRSATQLANSLKLSNATLSSILKELLAFKLIKVDSSSSVVGYGRKQVFYSINEDFGYLFLVNLSHNSSTIILTDIKENVLSSLELDIPGVEEKNVPTIVNKTKELLCSYGNPEKLKNIVISVSGFVKDSNEFISKEFSKEFKSVPMFITNDGDLFAYAELSKGKLKGINNAVFMYLSYGIGGSFIINGKMFEGDHANSGELGCLITDNNGDVEYLEDVSSLRVLKEKAGLLVGKKVSKEDLFSLYESNKDVRVMALESARKVGKALKSLINTLDISYVVINGEITRFGDDYINNINEETKDTFKPCKIEFSNLGKEGAKIGGVSLGVDYILKKSLKR